MFVGWVAARSSLRDLTVSARFPDHIFAAEPAPVIVTLRNTKHVLPSFSILVEARGPGNEVDENSKTASPARQTFARLLQLRAAQCCGGAESRAALSDSWSCADRRV